MMGAQNFNFAPNSSKQGFQPQIFAFLNSEFQMKIFKQKHFPVVFQQPKICGSNCPTLFAKYLTSDQSTCTQHKMCHIL